MFAVDELDDKEFLARVVSDTIFGLKRLEKTKNKTKKKNKKKGYRSIIGNFALFFIVKINKRQ